MIHPNRFSRTFIRQIFFTLAVGWLLFLSACTPPTGPTPAEGNTASSQNGGEQTIYLPLAQSGNASGEALPADPPLSEWAVGSGAVPIMPGALAGKEADGQYIFTIPVSMAEVETYYLQEMPNRGWQTLSIGESMEVKDLLFQQGDARLTIHIEFLSEQTLSYVVMEG